MTLEKILIVEDDPAMRADFVEMVEKYFTVLGAVGTLHEARAMLRKVLPDVALVDLGLPDGDGAVFISELADANPRADILVTTVFGDEAHVVRALQAGAKGYLLKDSDSGDLMRALKDIRDGGSPISPQVARYLLKRFHPEPRRGSELRERLSPRELEVLNLIARGFSASEAAGILGVAVSTVTAHTKGIYGKLAVHSRNEAVFEARQRGLID